MRLTSNYALTCFLCTVNAALLLLFFLFGPISLGSVRKFQFLIQFLLPLLAIYFAFPAFSQIKREQRIFKGSILVMLGVSGAIILLVYQLLNFQVLLSY